VGKFDAVAKGSAGGHYGIGEAQCAEIYGEVCCGGHGHARDSSMRIRAGVEGLWKNGGNPAALRNARFESGWHYARMFAQCASLKRRN